MREGPFPIEVVRKWLTERRDLTRRKLARDGEPLVPGRADPKSAFWRTQQALAAPLKPDERADLETIIAVANKWLTTLERADERTVALLSEAMVLSRADSRSHAELLFRLRAADIEDAGRQRKDEIALLGYGKRGAETNRKASRQRVEATVRAIQSERPDNSWRKICDEAGRHLGLSGSRIRSIVKKSDFAGAVAEQPHAAKR
jgi:hypothetical protein